MTGICPDCGRSWDDVRRGGRLGCPSCWDAFRQELSEVVTGMHGSDRQPGEEDLRTQIHQRQRKLLEEELRSALACEDYARAGKVRDLLRAEGEAS